MSLRTPTDCRHWHLMLGFLRHPNLHRGFPARPERPGRHPPPALRPRPGTGTVAGSGGGPGRDRGAVLAPAGGGGSDAGAGGGTRGGADTGAVAEVFVNVRVQPTRNEVFSVTSSSSGSTHTVIRDLPKQLLYSLSKPSNAIRVADIERRHVRLDIQHGSSVHHVVALET